jgi:pseudaminic acid cytidylyltransferase
MTSDYMPAIVAARGGSVRIPRKNLKLFCGKPLIAWTIEAARGCKYASDVFMTTDDDEIADVSTFYGAKVIRRDKISDAKEVGTIPFLKAMKHIRDNVHFFDHAVCALPTTPCRVPGDFDRLVENYRRGRYRYSIFGYNPREAQLFIKLEKDEGVSLIFDKDHGYYTWCAGDNATNIETTQMFVDYQEGKVIEGFLKMLLGIVPVKQWQCQDTDTPEEWEIAEYWFKRKVIDVYGKNPYEGGRIA